MKQLHTETKLWKIYIFSSKMFPFNIDLHATFKSKSFDPVHIFCARISIKHAKVCCIQASRLWSHYSVNGSVACSHFLALTWELVVIVSFATDQLFRCPASLWPLPCCQKGDWCYQMPASQAISDYIYVYYCMSSHSYICGSRIISS